jgi:hypothetical protein
MEPERANGAVGFRALLHLDLPGAVGRVSLSVSGKEDNFVHTLNGGRGQVAVPPRGGVDGPSVREGSELPGYPLTLAYHGMHRPGRPVQGLLLPGKPHGGLRVRSPAIGLGTVDGSVVVSSFAVDFRSRRTTPSGGTSVWSADNGAYEGQLLDDAAGTATLYTVP